MVSSAYLRLFQHKLESRLLGEISITSDADDTILMAESEEELKRLLMKVKQNEKVGLRLNIQKIRSFSYSDHFNIQKIK